jgi:hypothetical protein
MRVAVNWDRNGSCLAIGVAAQGYEFDLGVEVVHAFRLRFDGGEEVPRFEMPLACGSGMEGIERKVVVSYVKCQKCSQRVKQ